VTKTKKNTPDILETSKFPGVIIILLAPFTN